jgi:hypothetical protein
MTNREIAEMIAKFRTPPGLNWEPLADDIETLLDSKDRGAERQRSSGLDKSAQTYVR